MMEKKAKVRKGEEDNWRCSVRGRNERRKQSRQKVWVQHIGSTYGELQTEHEQCWLVVQ